MLIKEEKLMTKERFSNILVIILFIDIILFFLVPMNDRTIWFFGFLVLLPSAVAINYSASLWLHKRNARRKKLEQG